ncbi:phage tail tape measure protein [Micrococcus luteus]|uniref:phage tail tape measure protein n=1 Tax=Micrococcus luteus TaxID=1270 RepID=UPI00140D263A|nr:phage tail tape measure protein [Micrococcus luteus]NHQ56824.1 phage tail tape measure protein [Micrococcus luteus]
MSENLTVKARYEADVSSYNAAMQAAARETDKLATAADKAGTAATKAADVAERAAQKMAAAQEKAKTAQDRAADAAGRLKVAQERLEAARKSGDTVRLVAAEEGVARAQREVESTARRAATAHEAYEAAAERAEAAARGLGDQMDKTASKSGRVFDALRQNSADLQTAGTSLAAVGAGALAFAGGTGKLAMDWESAFAGVKKTVDDSTEGYAQLEGELRNLAKTLPATHTEVAAVAEAAGQLGVAREDIVGFTATMIDLGETTNLTADEAATNIAQISNVMGTMDREGSEGVARFGAALVELGNNGASTEKEILDMAQRIAGAASTVGASESDVLALSNTLASMGIRAEQGGGVATRVILKMRSAVDEGGESLETFAQIAGTSAEEFAAKFRSSPMEALDLVAQGIGRVNTEGGNVTATLKDMGIKGTEETQVMLALASAGDLLSESLRMGDEAWASNSALAAEAEKRYETSEARIRMAWNNIKDAAIDAGGTILPVTADLAESVATVVGSFTSLPGPVKGAVGALAGVGGAFVSIAGGAMVLIPRFVEARDALEDLAPAGSKARGALVGLGKAAAVASAAFVGFSVLKGWANDAAPATKGLEETTNAVLRLKDAADGDFTALDDLFSSGESIRDLGDAIRYADPSDLDSHMESFGSTVLGLETPAYRAREQFDTLGKTLATMDAESAAEQFRKLREAAEAEGSTMLSTWEGVKEYMPAYAASVEAASNATGKAADEATLYGIAMGHLPDHMKPAQEAAEAVATAAEDATESLGALGQVDADSKVGGIAEAMGILADESEEAGDQLDGVVDALTRMGMVQQNSAEAMMGFEQALADVTAAAEENASTLDITTEAGRNNRAALHDLMDAGRQLYEANIRAGEGQGVLTDGLMRTYEGLVDAAVQMGATSAEAETLARELMDIPPGVDVETHLSSSALVAAEATGQAIEAIPGYKGVQVVVSDEGTTGTIQSRIDDITGKTEYVHVSDDGSTTTVQQQIHNIAGVERTVWVDDQGTIYGTQQDIYAITGKDVDVVAIPHTSEAENALNYAARNRTVSIFAKYTGIKTLSDLNRESGAGRYVMKPEYAEGGIASLRGYSTGGRLPYTGLGTDMILGVTGSGMPIARVDDGEWIINQKASKRFHGVLSAINRGDPSVRHLAGYAGGGRPGREWSATSINPVVNVNTPAAPGVDVNAIASAVVAGVAALPAPRIYMGERQLGAAVRESMNYTRR